mgnify:CR=1 FL=1
MVKDKYTGDPVERYKFREKSVPQSIYAIRHRNGKKAIQTFLVESDPDAKTIFQDYLLTHSKKSQNEELVLFEVAHYDPMEMVVTIPMDPQEIHSSNKLHNAELKQRSKEKYA